MLALSPALQPVDVQMCSGEIHLVPAQRHQLADPEPMAEGNEDHGRVAIPPAPPLARCLHQSIDLGLGEILAWPDLGILLPLRRRVPPYNCSDFSVSGGIAHVRQHRRKPSVSVAHCTVFGFFRNSFPSRRWDRHSGVQRLPYDANSFDYGRDSKKVTKVDTGKNFSWP